MTGKASGSSPNLKINGDDAKRKIKEQIEKGRRIRDQEIGSKDDLTKAERESGKWSSYSITLLVMIFSDNSIAENYNSLFNSLLTNHYYSAPPLDVSVQYFREDMDSCITELESVLEKIELICEFSGQSASSKSISQTEAIPDTSSIFIVHGTDPTNDRYLLKDLLGEWKIDAVILHEQPNRGRTIIEKFEEHSDEVGCAIVLLTPDDEGRMKGEDNWRPRARQNVILELGFFFGKLGRGKVICLHKGNIELPSDISGIIYIHFDTDLKKEVYADLRKELEEIGFL